MGFRDSKFSEANKCEFAMIESNRSIRPVHTDAPQLPASVAAFSQDFCAGVHSALGDAFAALYLYGALAFHRPENWRIDFDFHVLLNRPLSQTERAAIKRLHEQLGEASLLGRELDGYYILLADANQSERPPASQTWGRAIDHAWALHCAHIHAGRFFLVFGLDPRAIVPVPTWAQITRALASEMRFIESHPEEAAFGILNSARVLYSVRTRDVVISKYQAAKWALDNLPSEWRDVIRAAVRFYSQAATEADMQLLNGSCAAFVAYVSTEIYRVQRPVV
jgi:hypothetical protein